MAVSLKIRTSGDACIIRYDRGEGDLKSILDTNYSNLATADRQAVVDYVASKRPDIPYIAESL